MMVFCQAILFDMDGTLVDSTAGVERAWHLFRESYPHIDVDKILSTSHGVRTVDNLKIHCGISDLALLESESARFEQAILGGGVVILPGAQSIIADTPDARWAICTSATRAYASAALTSADIPIPNIFVAAEDVKQGKPFPDPYLLGAKLSGIDPKQCVVFEDAPSGVRSGKAAGCVTIALLTTHSRESLEAAGADYIVRDLSSVSVKNTDNGLEITLDA